MVDDEAAGGLQAVRAEVSAVAVAGQDKQAGALRGGDDLALDAAGALGAGTGAAEALGGVLEELGGGRGGEVFQAGAGVAPPAFGRAVPPGLTAAEQADEGAVRSARDVGRGDVEQGDVGVRRGVGAGGDRQPTNATPPPRELDVVPTDPCSVPC